MVILKYNVLGGNATINPQDFMQDFPSLKFLANTKKKYRVFEEETNETWMMVGFQHVPAKGIFLPWIRMYILFKKENITRMDDFFKSNLIKDLVDDYCDFTSIDEQVISYILIVIPRKSQQKFLLNCEISHPWALHSNFADNVENNRVCSSFHLFWQNPSFEEQKGLTANLISQMDGAIRIVDQTSKLVNFCKEINENFGEELIDYASFIALHKKQIKKTLTKYKQRKKMIWAKTLLSKDTFFHSTTFGRSYRQDLRLLNRMGFKIAIVSTKSREWNALRDRFKIQLILTLVECLTTEGSSFSNLILPNGCVNPSILTDVFIDELVGDFAGVMTMEFQNRTLFAGLAFGKISNESPLTLRTALLLPQIFRENGLGSLLAMYGMNYMEKYYNIQKFEVFSTTRNVKVEKLTTSTGFFEYGTISRMAYDITGHNSELSYSIGMNRTYRFSNSLLHKLLIQNPEPAQYNNWKQAFKLQHALAK
ncbi:hypothetical protein NEF87_001757 [Candidatus Lokiarchaeum ossiferum]|uniref:N-acetyltransferase domain-containing protein n=1 Tax=Candidatus Lokiarchaeum ossiferum TaxID=2951803 RepID=A0ABY6HSW1_9ARCH|nr:hypothetical protein NEF87_001757 [Candidatus Lokiarchaeum sp. B-35]